MSLIADKNLLTIPQAADQIGISPHTCRIWCREGRFPGAVKLGRKMLIPRDSLDAVFEPVVPVAEAETKPSSAPKPIVEPHAPADEAPVQPETDDAVATAPAESPVESEDPPDEQPVAEEPKPKRRRRRTKKQIEADAKATASDEQLSIPGA